MTQKKKTGISRLLEFGGRYRWMTVVACILSGLSSVLMLCPFLCIWLVLRDVLAALGETAPESDFAAMEQLTARTGCAAPRQLADLQGKPERFRDVIRPDEIGKTALDLA